MMKAIALLVALTLSGCQPSGFVSLTPAAQNPDVQYRYRDERTGRLVSEDYARAHRKTTVREIVR